MVVELQLLTEMEQAEALLRLIDGSATMHSDGAAKHGHNRLAICHSYSEGGVGGGVSHDHISHLSTVVVTAHHCIMASAAIGSEQARHATERRTRALAIIDLSGGTAEDEAEAIHLTFSQIATTYNTLLREKNRPESGVQKTFWEPTFGGL